MKVGFEPSNRIAKVSGSNPGIETFFFDLEIFHQFWPTSNNEVFRVELFI